MHDFRYAVRTLVRSPGFTLAVLGLLTLGVGANTALFSVVNAVLFAPARATVHPEREIVVFGKDPQGRRTPVAYPDYRELQAQCRSCEALAAYRMASFTITGLGDAFRVDGVMASAQYFQAHPVKLAAGRAYSAEEDRPSGPPVALINYQLWQRRLGGQHTAIGKTITLNDRSFTIIGGLPKDFDTLPGEMVWVPLEPWVPELKMQDRRNQEGVFVLARLSPEASLSQMEAELNTVMGRLASQYRETNSAVGITLTRILELQTSRYRTTLWLLFGAVGLLLLIACTNIANLCLVRASGRRREMTIRVALGASRSHLLRQVVAESSMLAIVGGMLGIAAGWWGTRILQSVAPANLPHLWSLQMDWRVFVYGLAIALVAGILFGLGPGAFVNQINVNPALKEGGRGTSTSNYRLRRALLMTEVALAVVLLIGSGLLLRSLEQLHQVDIGIQPKNVLTVQIPLDQPQYTPARRGAFIEAARQQIAALPGVQSVGISASLPLLGAYGIAPFVRERDEATTPVSTARAAFQPVSSGYLEALGLRMLRGRAINSTDSEESRPVAVINESFARHLWAEEDPIGKRIGRGRPGEIERWIEIIGVVGDVRQNGPDRDAEFEAYIPLSQAGAPPVVYVSVRTSGPPSAIASSVKQVFQSIDSGIPVASTMTMEELFSAWLAPRGFTVTVLGLFASLAFILAVIGIYGVLSYLVAQRTQEIGVRVALGATRVRILLWVTREAFVWALSGCMAGIALALLLSRVMNSLVYGVSSTDTATIASVTAFMLLVAMLASIVPAIRALRIDPVIALRQE